MREHNQGKVSAAPSPYSEGPGPDTWYDLCELITLVAWTQRVPPEMDALPSACSAHIPQDRWNTLPALLVRIRALGAQCSPTGPLRFTPLCAIPSADNTCDLCGNPLLEDGLHFRCSLCAQAARLLLGYEKLTEWLAAPIGSLPKMQSVPVQQQQAEETAAHIPQLFSFTTFFVDT